jgi:hypothetical protein
MPARVRDQPRYRGMNSLALLVQEAFKRDPHAGDPAGGRLEQLPAAERRKAEAILIPSGRARYSPLGNVDISSGSPDREETCPTRSMSSSTSRTTMET